MSFRLPTLHLGTEFDKPIAPLAVPGVLSKENQSALTILDGASRAPRRLARLHRRVAVVGVKIAEPQDGVRVTLTLLVDGTSAQMWNRRHHPDDGDRALSDEHRHHRLVQVSLQGRPRGLVLLTLRRSDGDGAVRQQLELDVPASDIEDTGLLMFGFEEPAGAPAWATARMLEDPLVGLCLANVKVAPLEGAVGPSVSTGRSRRRNVVSPARPGFFLVNSGTSEGSHVVTLRRRSGEGKPKVRGRRAQAQRLLRLARNRRPALRDVVVPQAPVDVEMVALDGTQLSARTVAPDGSGTYRFELPAGHPAVFVRARLQPGTDARPQPQAWQVDVTEGPRT